MSDCTLRDAMLLNALVEYEEKLQKLEAERDTLKELNAELIEALEELVDLMQDTINGEYKPDSFTLQPAQAAIKQAKELKDD